MASLYPAESFYESSLATSITATASSITVTTAPVNSAGYMVIEPKSSSREIIKYTGKTGNTLTGCVRGLATSGTDDSAGTGKSHPAGATIAMKDVHYYLDAVVDVFNGVSSSGTNTYIFGDGNTISASDRYWQINTSSLSAYMGLNNAGQMVVSEDGINEYMISAGGSGVVAGNGISIIAGAVAINGLSSGGIKISATKAVVEVSTGIFRDLNGIGIDQSSAMYWTGLHNFTDISIDSTQISASATEINKLIGVTTNVSVVTQGGIADNAHYHSLITNLIPTNDIWQNYELRMLSGEAHGWITGGTTVTSATDSYIEITGTAAYMMTFLPGVSTANDSLTFDDNKAILFKVRAKDLASTDTSPVHFGFTYNGYNDFNVPLAATKVSGCLFCLSGYSLYSKTGNGAGITITNLSGVANAHLWHNYEIAFYPGTSCGFYVNGTLMATHTTNLPTTGVIYVGGGTFDSGILFLSKLKIGIQN